MIKQLAQIGFGTIVDELSNADFAWVAVGVVLAQLTFITDALSFRGAVLAPLPLGPCVALESAIKFVNLTMPGSAGRVAINIRFLQRMGVPTSQAVTSGAVDGASETIIQILLVLVTLPFVDIAIDTDRIDISAPSTGTLDSDRRRGRDRGRGRRLRPGRPCQGDARPAVCAGKPLAGRSQPPQAG